MSATATKTKKRPEQNSQKKFRVVNGSHSQMKWVPATDEEIFNGVPGLVKRADDRYYRLQVETFERGGIVETDRDLDKEFNILNHHNPHLVRVGMNGQPLGNTPNPWDTLESKSLDQLKALAMYEEIDLGEAKSKEQILKILTDYRDGVGEE